MKSDRRVGGSLIISSANTAGAFYTEMIIGAGLSPHIKKMWGKEQA